MLRHDRGEAMQRAAGVRLVIFDVDGVLTDGRLFFDPDGNEFKGFHSRDGQGKIMLQRSGVAVAVISGRYSPAVSKRMDSLGIEHAYQGCRDKLPAYQELLDKLGLTPEQTAHVGDDLPDLSLLRRVGFAVAVADAHPSILPYVHWITRAAGGQGAAREVCDFIMEAQGTLPGLVESHF